MLESHDSNGLTLEIKPLYGRICGKFQPTSLPGFPQDITGAKNTQDFHRNSGNQSALKSLL
jgi:hypothetical protein